MNKIFITLLYVLAHCCNIYAQENHVLENKYLKREFSIDKYLHTVSITNKQTQVSQSPFYCEEFSLRFSDGTDKTGTDFVLTSKDFAIKSNKDYTWKGKNPGKGLQFTLKNERYKITVDVFYELCEKDAYLHKYLVINSEKARTLERIDIDQLSCEGAYQPYNKNTITAQAYGNWSPGLGQPIYNYVNATFWGVEFPAASNTATNQQIKLGYLYGKQILPNKPYRSYKSVMGIADDPLYISDAFFDYINNIRIRPLRLQIQYNSWFDHGREINEQKFEQSAKNVYQELVVKRGVAPLRAYVIDDGWQDLSLSKLNEKDGVWTINDKFSKDFKKTHATMKELNGKLGIWLSPGCYFGGKKMVRPLKENGYEALASGMSMTGSRYMDKLENRILNFTRQGVCYFKFDGLFGNLGSREFDVTENAIPIMPQIIRKDMSANDFRLNDPMYDEFKMYYIVTGTERLMQIMRKQHEINPDIFIALTNGAYLSPWWLQYADVIWLINCGDAPRGCKNRSEELVFRDGIYHNTFRIENAQYPLSSIFNHEPKKKSAGESPEEFKKYLFMNLSRGTSFIELYLKIKNMSQQDWDILAEGLKWAQEVFPAIKRIKMLGGDPTLQQIYGYSGWNESQGYISLHNPSDKEKTFSIHLNRDIGIIKKFQNFSISSPLGHDQEISKRQWNYGDILTLKIPAKSIKLLTFKE